MGQRIYVMLGRTGDILNILPLAYDDFQKTGQRSAIMVSRDFAGLLSGCNYVHEIVFDGSMWELDRAIKEAEALSENVKVVQLTGPYELIKQIVITRNGAEYRTTTESFQKDHWNLAGRLGDWKNQIPLVFDNRNADREKALIEQHVPDSRKRLILLHADGISSPFPYKRLLVEMLTLKFCRQYDILDLSLIKADQFYDLLGLFEHPRVHCLVATDSAPLHLAYACKRLPVVALVNDKPSLWHGSVWRPNHAAHIRYRDFPDRAVEMLDAIAEIGKPGSWFAPNQSKPKIIHVWSEYERNGVSSAWENYEEDATWIKCPVEIGAVGHDSKHSRYSGLKDDKRFPFLKDVIRLASLRADTDDIICLTRNGALPDRGITKILLEKAPCYSHREIFDGQRHYHPAVDLFAFKKSWWQEHQKELPDLIMGKDIYWPRILKEFMVKHGAAETQVVYAMPKPAKPATSETVPNRVAHNEKLAVEFLKKHGIKYAVPPVSQQLDLMPLNRKALYPYGYNPSIIRFKDKLLMAYRWHSDGTLGTTLAMAELDNGFNPVNNGPIEVTVIKGQLSVDDPRLFVYEDELYCAYVSSTWPQNPPKCTVHYGRIVKQGEKWIIPESFQIKYGNNDGSAMEKNWVPFAWDGKLYFIYHNQPEQIVIQVVGDQVVTEHKSPTPHWKWGKIHAGTTPVPFENKLIRFFHTRMDNEPAPARWRYYLGACIMEPEPPFNIIKVSSEPVARASEEDDTTDMQRASCIHRKANVIFPGSCLPIDGAYLISIGINDCAAAIAKISDYKL